MNEWQTSASPTHQLLCLVAIRRLPSKSTFQMQLNCEFAISAQGQCQLICLHLHGVAKQSAQDRKLIWFLCLWLISPVMEQNERILATRPRERSRSLKFDCTVQVFMTKSGSGDSISWNGNLVLLKTVIVTCSAMQCPYLFVLCSSLCWCYREGRGPFGGLEQFINYWNNRLSEFVVSEAF